MKIVFVLFVLAVFVTGSLAQNGGKLGKGEKCSSNNDCMNDRDMKCVNGYCGCRKGQRQELESHSDNSEIYICSDVVGKGCSTNEDCSFDLKNSKCISNRCECKAQDNCSTRKEKGEECEVDSECIEDARHMACVNKHCGCKKGQRQELTSSPSGSSEYSCRNVVGLGCTRDDNCYVDLYNATCNLQSQVCECKKENGCSGASTMAIISFLPMVFVSIVLLKSW